MPKRTDAGDGRRPSSTPLPDTGSALSQSEPSRARACFNPRNADQQQFNETVGLYNQRREDQLVRTGNGNGHSSSPGLRTGRFIEEERKCFRRVPTPSSEYENKAEVFWQSTGELRMSLSESGLHTLPTLKGDFFNRSEFKERLPTRSEVRRIGVFSAERAAERPHVLPDEELTTRVLDVIYPRASTPPLGIVRANSTLHPGGLHLQDVWKSATGKAGALDALGCFNKAKEAKQKMAENMAANPSPALSRLPQKTEDMDKHKLLLEFRRKILEKFVSIQEAFDSFDADGSKNVSSSEWAALVSDICTKREARMLFEHIDSNKDGRLTLYEFHVAIEAVAPIRCLEDVRKRWLAHGYPSQAKVVEAMKEGGIADDRRLTLAEFGVVLSKVHIHEADEHLAIFSVISDPGSYGTVSISELASAMATVSPALLLEDVRDRILTKFGTLDQAYWKLDMDKTGNIEMHEFKMNSEKYFKLTHVEARKCFSQIDCDNSGEISRNEFVSALKLSSPNLLVEDFRKKVMQRFKSILKAFQEAFLSQSGDDNLDDNLELSLDEFYGILQTVECSFTDTKRLFELVDADMSGTLTVNEFAKGIRFFAPAVMLQDLRLLIMKKHSTAAEAFVHIHDRHKPLSVEGFRQMLSSCTPDLTQGIEVQGVFDLLDTANDGRVCLSELIAALQSGQPGSQVPLSRDERELRVKQTIMGEMHPFLKGASDLKAQVRAGLRAATPDAKGRSHSKDKHDKKEEHHQHHHHLGNPHGAPAPEGAPRKPSGEGGKQPEKKKAKNVDELGPQNAAAEVPRTSYHKLHREFQKLTKPNHNILQDIVGYYRGCGKTLSSNTPVLQENPQSRFALHQACTSHGSQMKKGTKSQAVLKEGSKYMVPPSQIEAMSRNERMSASVRRPADRLAHTR